MTRVTNFGRKRTYLQAGFGNDEEELAPRLGEKKDPGALEKPPGEESVHISPTEGEPPKKRKRIRKKKPKANPAEGVTTSEAKSTGEGKDDKGDGSIEKENTTGPSKKALKKKKWKELEKGKKQRRLLSSEMRRQKRIDERMATTTCFACREQGHAAKDCPNVKSNAGGDGKVKGKIGVGICYRCGSARHTLSRCKKKVDESNPFPFASCFVCNGKGHLASACPENMDKGIYPNGGCCKLCGEKTHLAKDCELRNKDKVDTLMVIGTGERPGADEDEFHMFKRRKEEVEKEAKAEGLRNKLLQVKAGAHSGILKSFASAPKPAKKVVFF